MIAYAACFVLLFATLNELSIMAGITQYIPKAGHLQSIVINFFSISGGLVILAVILAFITATFTRFKHFSQNMPKSFFLLSYSFTPMFLMGWVPFLVIKIMALAWSLFFLALGIRIKFRESMKNSFYITGMVLLAILLLSFISQNYILGVVPNYLLSNT